MSAVKKWNRQEYHNWIQTTIDLLTQRIEEDKVEKLKMKHEQQSVETPPIPDELLEQNKEEFEDFSESASSWTPSDDESSDDSEMEAEIENMKRDRARLLKGGKPMENTNGHTEERGNCSNNNKVSNLRSHLLQAMSGYSASCNEMKKFFGDVTFNWGHSLTHRQTDNNDINHYDSNNIITDKNYDIGVNGFANRPNNIANDADWVAIGSGQTLVKREEYAKIKWDSYTKATRQLLAATFSKRVLATHSLTGKPSPAFTDKPAKMCLDPEKVSDIIIEITDRFVVKKNLIRCVITTKCADESKMFRARMNKMTNKTLDKENIPREN